MRSEARTIRMHQKRTLAALLLLALAWSSLSGGRALLDPDEGRYAEIPREMLAGGDWVIPHLDGLAYLEKPPLQYWATAAVYSVVGITDWSARAWTGLTSFLTLVIVYLFARREWGDSAGRWAAGVLASGLLFLSMGHINTLDAGLTFFLTLALLAFITAQSHRDDAGSVTRSMLVCWTAMAAAVLSKGVIGVAIPAAVVAIYMCWQRDWRVLSHLRLRSGLPLFALIVLPWFVLAARRNPDFLRFFFIHEHLQRFMTLSADRYRPWWYFAVILLAGSLPWAPQTVRALVRGARRNLPSGQFDARRLLWVWCVFILLFFSASNSKLAPYILPVFPAIALLTAASPAATRKQDFWWMLGLTLLMAMLLLAVPALAGWLDHRGDSAAVAHALAAALARVALLLLAGSAVALGLYRRERCALGIAALGLAWFGGCGLMLKSLAPAAPWLTAKYIAGSLQQPDTPAPTVYSVNEFRHTLEFYARRPMVLVDYRGELALGLDEAPQDRFRSLQQFEQVWLHSRNAVAVMPLDTWRRLKTDGLPMRIAASDPIDIVVRR